VAAYPSSASAMRRLRSLIFDAELSGLIVLVANGWASLSMGFSMVAIGETLMDCCASFETSLRQRGNYGTPRLSKTGAGNLTLFIAPRLPYSLRLQLAQIVDDRKNTVSHRLIRAAGNIDQRIGLPITFNLECLGTRTRNWLQKFCFRSLIQIKRITPAMGLVASIGAKRP